MKSKPMTLNEAIRELSGININGTNETLIAALTELNSCIGSLKAAVDKSPKADGDKATINDDIKTAIAEVTNINKELSNLRLSNLSSEADKALYDSTIKKFAGYLRDLRNKIGEMSNQGEISNSDGKTLKKRKEKKEETKRTKNETESAESVFQQETEHNQSISKNSIKFIDFIKHPIKSYKANNEILKAEFQINFNKFWGLLSFILGNIVVFIIELLLDRYCPQLNFDRWLSIGFAILAVLSSAIIAIVKTFKNLKNVPRISVEEHDERLSASGKQVKALKLIVYIYFGLLFVGVILFTYFKIWRQDWITFLILCLPAVLMLILFIVKAIRKQLGSYVAEDVVFDSRLYEQDDATLTDWYLGFSITDKNNKQIQTEKNQDNSKPPFEIFLESDGQGKVNLCLVILAWNYKASCNKVGGELPKIDLNLGDFDKVEISFKDSSDSISKFTIGSELYTKNGGKIILNVKTELESEPKSFPIEKKYGFNGTVKFDDEHIYKLYAIVALKQEVIYTIKKTNGGIKYKFSNLPHGGLELKYSVRDGEKSAQFKNSVRFKRLKGFDRNSQLKDIHFRIAKTTTDAVKYYLVRYVVDKENATSHRVTLKSRNMRCPYCGRILKFYRRDLIHHNLYCNGEKVGGKGKGKLYCVNNMLLGGSKATVPKYMTTEATDPKYMDTDSINFKLKKSGYLVAPNQFVYGNNATITFCGNTKCGKSTLISRLLNIKKEAGKITTTSPEYPILRKLLADEAISLYFPEIDEDEAEEDKRFSKKLLSGNSVEPPYEPRISYDDYGSELYGLDTKITPPNPMNIKFLMNAPFILQIGGNYLSFYDTPGGAFQGITSDIEKEEFKQHPIFNSDIIIMMSDCTKAKDIEIISNWTEKLYNKYFGEKADSSVHKEVAIAIVLNKLDAIYEEFKDDSYIKKSAPNLGEKTRYVGSCLEEYIDKRSDEVERYLSEKNKGAMDGVKKWLKQFSVKGCPIKYFATSSIGRKNSIDKCSEKDEKVRHLYDVNPVGVESLLIWICYQLGVIE